ncbi:hypothetical protein AYL20_07425 [Acinetobacter venetianus]|uniref:DUF4882 family protein n=1 Tax=Acinetobacter venetianus TaxID=52133 RepID=UPI000775A4DD|nr:DUF4882 family protein [Acinetobacter venetianus]KXO78197.1 hypothetical protein AYL20_07425 [Acinetobacter venetianus]
MKKLVLGSLITIAATSNVFAECTYNFNASVQDIAALEASNAAYSSNYRKTLKMTNVDTVNQSGYDTISYYSNQKLDKYLASKSYVQFTTQYKPSFPDNVPIVDKAIASSDIFAQEFIFDVSDLQVNLGTNSQTYEYGFVLSGSSQIKNELSMNLAFTKMNNYPSYPDGDYLGILAVTTKSDGNGKITFSTADRRFHPVQIPTSGKIRLGIYVNQNTKQLGYILNGINYGYLNVLMENKLENISYLGVINQDHFTNSALTGKTAGLQLITDKSKMQYTYPTGTKDICGNVI